MNHIPFQASTTTNEQMHASEVLTQNRQVYSTWPSAGKDNAGQKLEPLIKTKTKTKTTTKTKTKRRKRKTKEKDIKWSGSVAVLAVRGFVCLSL
jgi:hypothetical protein